jgi:antitoxin CptB
MNDKSRLYWQCRRGMLELDLLLQGFLEQGHDALSSDEKQAFENLLTCPDDLLLAYLLGHTVPADGLTADVVEKIRHAAVP